jgi:L-serine dehydratase
MPTNYKSVFDIIGPIMIGPSSSHTAGAVALGRAANLIFHAPIKAIMIRYYESFAKTHRGHGTDYAIVAGLLGFPPSDSRVPIAIELAQKQGIHIKFIEVENESPIGHPNTAVIQLTGTNHQVTVTGCSIGGGTIQIREILMNGFDIKPTGPLPLLLVQGNVDQVAFTKRLKRLTKINQQTTYHSTAGNLIEYELDTHIQANTLTDLTADWPQLIYL